MGQIPVNKSLRASLTCATPLQFPKSIHQLHQSSPKMKAKGIVADFGIKSMTVESIEKAVDEIVVKYSAAYVSVGKINSSEVTFDNTIKVLIDLEREMGTEEGPLYFPQHVAEDKALRDASVAADKKLSVFEVDLSMKKEVFD